MAKPVYFGKYRAKVVDINDPEKRARIQVLCPKVLGDYRSNWCEPCSPFAYDGGGDLSLPKVGETVWVEFEEGDPNKPIYVGNWWSMNKSPFTNYSQSADTRIFERDGAKITMNADSIVISIGSSTITMTESTIAVNSPRIDFN